jgi:hypothetical protein
MHVALIAFIYQLNRRAIKKAAANPAIFLAFLFGRGRFHKVW